MKKELIPMIEELHIAFLYIILSDTYSSFFSKVLHSILPLLNILMHVVANVITQWCLLC